MPDLAGLGLRLGRRPHRASKGSEAADEPFEIACAPALRIFFGSRCTVSGATGDIQDGDRTRRVLPIDQESLVILLLRWVLFRLEFGAGDQTMAYVDPDAADVGTNWNAGAPGAMQAVRVVNEATGVGTCAPGAQLLMLPTTRQK